MVSNPDFLKANALIIAILIKRGLATDQQIYNIVSQYYEIGLAEKSPKRLGMPDYYNQFDQPDLEWQRDLRFDHGE